VVVVVVVGVVVVVVVGVVVVVVVVVAVAVAVVVGVVVVVVVVVVVGVVVVVVAVVVVVVVAAVPDVMVKLDGAAPVHAALSPTQLFATSAMAVLSSSVVPLTKAPPYQALANCATLRSSAHPLPQPAAMAFEESAVKPGGRAEVSDDVALIYQKLSTVVRAHKNVGESTVPLKTMT